MNEIARIGVAIFGFGRAGNFHAKNLICNKRVSLKWVVQHNQEKARAYMEENFLDVQVAHPSEIDRVLADNSVQAVVIAAPTQYHEEYVLRSLKAGKAVFCEKPLAVTYDAVGKLKQKHPPKFFSVCKEGGREEGRKRGREGGRGGGRDRGMEGGRDMEWIEGRRREGV